MFSSFREEVVAALAEYGISNPVLEEPPEGMGDLAFPCFGLAKEWKKSPVEIAKELEQKLKGQLDKELIDKIEAKGPYVNFFIDYFMFSKLAILNAGEVFEEGKGKKVLVEFSSPNIAKPMHAGHLMTTIVGDSIYRIMKACGYKTERINHLGDWGTQFGKWIVAYEKWGSEAALKKNPIEELVRVYVKFHEQANAEELEQKAREVFAKLEKGDKKLRTLWKKFVDLSMKEFKRTYEDLGVDFDHWTGESFYEDMLSGVIKDALKKKVAIEEDGSAVIKFNDLPPFLIRKSDGSSLYSTRDLAALKYRASKFKFQKCIYVVGSQQTLHFQQLFRAAGLLGYADPEKCVHVPTGYIILPEGAMSTRKGNAILANEILSTAEKLAAKIIDEKNPGLKNKKKVVHQVAIGAVKYANLAQHRGKDVVFDWDKVVNFQGNSGPYLQYTHARASSILAKQKPKKGTTYENEHERRLLKKISKFPDVVSEAALQLTPHMIAVYLFELAELFNKFYENCRVLQEKEPTRSARLLLVAAFKKTMQKGLDLLGIEAPEEM